MDTCTETRGRECYDKLEEKCDTRYREEVTNERERKCDKECQYKWVLHAIIDCDNSVFVLGGRVRVMTKDGLWTPAHANVEMSPGKHV